MPSEAQHNLKNNRLFFLVCQGQNSGIVNIWINIAPDVSRDYLQHANEANEGDV